jgi:hypothetical protein
MEHSSHCNPRDCSEPLGCQERQSCSFCRQLFWTWSAIGTKLEVRYSKRLHAGCSHKQMARYVHVHTTSKVYNKCCFIRSYTGRFMWYGKSLKVEVNGNLRSKIWCKWWRPINLSAPFELSLAEAQLFILSGFHLHWPLSVVACLRCWGPVQSQEIGASTLAAAWDISATKGGKVLTSRLGEFS